MRTMILAGFFVVSGVGLVTAQGMNATSDNLEAQNGNVSVRQHQIETVNDYSPAQATKARHLAEQAGYSSTEIEFAQAGNLFLSGTHGGDIYSLVVTPDGKLYASTGLPVSTAPS